jgi:hypothetical protein
MLKYYNLFNYLCTLLNIDLLIQLKPSEVLCAYVKLCNNAFPFLFIFVMIS